MNGFIMGIFIYFLTLIQFKLCLKKILRKEVAIEVLNNLAVHQLLFLILMWQQIIMLLHRKLVSRMLHF